MKQIERESKEMLKIIHRVNTIKGLKDIDTKFGVEIDLRSEWVNIILNHDAFWTWDNFEKYLENYKHKLMILNIKESWIEDKCVELLEKFDIKDYFLLDCEFPYIYSATRKWNKNIAIRYSEDEPIEQALLYKDKLDYLFIDVNTKLPLDEDVIKQMEWFQTCLVSPDRWGRPDDILAYKEKMIKLGFELDMVMVWKEYVHLWD